jgi:hypothetical protein
VAITAHGVPVQQVDTEQGGIEPRKVAAIDQAPRSSETRAVQPSIHELVELPSSFPEITIRLQMDELGNFSAPYDFSI